MIRYKVRLTKRIAQAEFIRDLNDGFTTNASIDELWCTLSGSADFRIPIPGSRSPDPGVRNSGSATETCGFRALFVIHPELRTGTTGGCGDGTPHVRVRRARPQREVMTWQRASMEGRTGIEPA